MIGRALLVLAVVAGIAIAVQARSGSLSMLGVENPERARQNYILKCQGCHRSDASGGPATSPAMAGNVARFLTAKGGREYLARVPGVATSALDDAQLAELLNWTLYRFDAAHVPQSFKPYSAAEIAVLRKSPLRTDAAAVRAAIIAEIGAVSPTRTRLHLPR